MTPVFPYLIRRSQDGWRGELLLRLRNGKSAYVVHLSLDQARMLAVEMRGLASDHCPLHHTAVRIAECLNARISHIIIKRLGASDEVAGLMRLVTANGMHSAYVDAAAGLAIAIHMGLPVFMDGEFSPAETPPDIHQHAADAGLPIPEYMEAPRGATPIPPAFHEVIEGLKMPDDAAPPEFRAADDEPGAAAER